MENMTKVRLTAAVCAISATVALAAPVGSAKSYFIAVKITRQATVNQLVQGRLKEKLTCTEACRFSTVVWIVPSVAKRLGFQHVANSKPFVIARNTGALTARSSKRFGFVLTPRAKKLLPKSNRRFRMHGSVQAAPKRLPRHVISLGWIVSMS